MQLLRNWKLSQFEKYEKELVETWEYERFENSLIKNLKRKLHEINEEIQFNRLTYQELVERTFKRSFVFREKSRKVLTCISSP